MTDGQTELHEQLTLFTSDHTTPEQRRERAIEHLRAKIEQLLRQLEILENEQ